MYMKLKDGKSKVLTFSYDDGRVQDMRLIELMDKHGLKGTFNINTGLYAPEDYERQQFDGRMKLSEAQALYGGSPHEVATHGLTHPFLERLPLPSLLTEVLEDRNNIEQQYHTITRGMAYPYGTYNDDVIECLQKCGIVYARTVKSTGKFLFPENWLAWHPTCHHGDKKLMELAKRFVETPLLHPQDNWLFYVWGHSFEFDRHNNWHIMEEFTEYVSGRDDVWYATNIEIYDYVKAYKQLEISVDETVIYNPSVLDVWIHKDGAVYCVHGGETLHI